MILVQDIIDRVTDLLLDKDRAEDAARWDNSELLRWVNDCRMAILTRRPQACSKVETLALVAGSRQSLPDSGVELIDIVRNMGADGNTPGRSIRRTDRQNIDDMDLYWHKGTPSAVISQFTYDDRIPKTFYVSPPAKVGANVELIYASIPAAVTAITDSLDMGLEYMEPVVNYIAYRAKSKDSQYANAGEAAAFYGAFADALGANQAAQTAISPNQPGNSV